MCIFCKIVNCEIPSNKIYEDDLTLAFLDITNDFVGHTLVIPKQHYANILDCPNDLLAAVLNTVKKVCNHYTDNCGFDGVNVLSNNGQCAGQSVFHLHFHIIPQTAKSPIDIFPKAKAERDFKGEFEKLRLL